MKYFLQLISLPQSPVVISCKNCLSVLFSVNMIVEIDRDPPFVNKNISLLFCLTIRFGRKKTVVSAMITASLFAIATVLLTMYNPGSNKGTSLMKRNVLNLEKTLSKQIENLKLIKLQI